MHTSRPLPGYLFRVVIGFMLGALAGGPAVWSAPQGGVIEGGQATIRQDGPATIIQQQSGRAIGEFDSFNVRQDERVELRQPGREAIFWAKDHQDKPSQIHGLIQGNGQFWLSNRNGILVGPTGTIDTAGTVLTSSFMRNERFRVRAQGCGFCRYRRLKQFRRLATRYERLARNYMAMLYLASAMIWIN